MPQKLSFRPGCPYIREGYDEIIDSNGTYLKPGEQDIAVCPVHVWRDGRSRNFVVDATYRVTTAGPNSSIRRAFEIAQFVAMGLDALYAANPDEFEERFRFPLGSIGENV